MCNETGVEIDPRTRSLSSWAALLPVSLLGASALLDSGASAVRAACGGASSRWTQNSRSPGSCRGSNSHSPQASPCLWAGTPVGWLDPWGENVEKGRSWTEPGSISERRRSWLSDQGPRRFHVESGRFRGEILPAVPSSRLLDVRQLGDFRLLVSGVWLCSLTLPWPRPARGPPGHIAWYQVAPECAPLPLTVSLSPLHIELAVVSAGFLSR